MCSFHVCTAKAKNEIEEDSTLPEYPGTVAEIWSLLKSLNP